VKHSKAQQARRRVRANAASRTISAYANSKPHVAASAPRAIRIAVRRPTRSLAISRVLCTELRRATNRAHREPQHHCQQRASDIQQPRTCHMHHRCDPLTSSTASTRVERSISQPRPLTTFADSARALAAVGCMRSNARTTSRQPREHKPRTLRATSRHHRKQTPSQPTRVANTTETNAPQHHP
jgi:hypothetical protein